MVNETELNNIRTYVSWLPHVGLAIGIILTIYFGINKVPASVWQTLYILFPFLILFIISIFLMKFLHVDFFTKPHKICALILSIILGISLLFTNIFIRPSSVRYITFKELVQMESDNLLGNSYLIYESDNCIYCIRMEEIYEVAIKRTANQNFLYVDLSDTLIDDPEVKKRRIAKIPLLVHCQNGVEINRLEGKHSLEEVVRFFNNR